jgi:hypothetical protein
VFNLVTQQWSKHLFDSLCAHTNVDTYYLGEANTNYVSTERRTFTNLDFADFLMSTTILSLGANSAVLASGTDNISVGDILYKTSVLFATITDIDPITSTVSYASDPGFSTGAIDVLAAIDCTVTWAPLAAGNPGITKQLHTAEVLFKRDFNGTAYLSFTSDLSPSAEEVPLEGFDSAAWGVFLWGDALWGGEPLRRGARQWIPRNKQRCSQLIVSFEHRVGFSWWQLEGVNVYGEPGSDRTSRR